MCCFYQNQLESSPDLHREFQFPIRLDSTAPEIRLALQAQGVAEKGYLRHAQVDYRWLRASPTGLVLIYRLRIVPHPTRTLDWEEVALTGRKALDDAERELTSIKTGDRVFVPR